MSPCFYTHVGASDYVQKGDMCVSSVDGTMTPVCRAAIGNPASMHHRGVFRPTLELFEALKDLLPFLPTKGDCLDSASLNELGMDVYHQAVLKARAALAKAEGATP